MEFGEFEEILQAASTQRLGRNYPEEIQIFDSWRATDSELQRVESELGVQLPAKYKEFMRRHGGGVFMFVDLLPVVSPDGRVDDLITVNKGKIRAVGFVAIAPVGTGDWWGFSVAGHICSAEVHFLDHENESVTPSFADFFDFLIRKGLRVDAER
ncbi:SMI1/KNR4 family protein [Actinomadura miaoliensis]|uniref:Knr4/Smi1-like domain-containing protein n=1 Tax=Actinomadura miaoliensis TaxID=430685 RepID=A0ABP7UV40_9ACTN